MKQTEFYCLKCRKAVTPKDEIKLRKLKNGKHALVSYCHKCDTKLFKFVKEDDVEKLSAKYKKCTKCPRTSPKKTSKKSKSKKSKSKSPKQRK